MPVLARIIACIGALLVLFACYIYIQFYNYDRCEYYSNTYHKCFTDAIDVDKYTQRVGRLIAKDAIKRANRKLIIGFVMIVISFFVPKDDSKYEYYKISPLWAYNNPCSIKTYRTCFT